MSLANGVVTLTGTVESWHDRRLAAVKAEEGGAAAINYEIEVAP